MARFPRFARRPGQAVPGASDAPPDAARRALLRTLGCGALAAGLTGASLGSARAASRDAQAVPAAFATPAATAGATRELTFHNTHTQESLRIAYCVDGARCESALARIAHVLRDHRSGETHAIDPQLLDLLHAVAGHCEREPEFEVISGYRSPVTNARLHARSNGVASHSLHMEGRAIDVRLVGCDLARLRDVALGVGRGGVGYYRDSRFVHLDTGRVRTWSG